MTHPFVSNSFEEYKAAFLYALALHWNLDLAAPDLCKEGADAAFTLAMALREEAPEQSTMPLDQEVMELDGTDEELFPWEEAHEGLPTDLGNLWKRYSQGQKFDTKGSLEQVTRYKDLPQRPPENNALGKMEAGLTAKLDKAWKVHQQGLLHQLRVQAKIFFYWRGTQKEPPAEKPRGKRSYYYNSCGPLV